MRPGFAETIPLSVRPKGLGKKKKGPKKRKKSPGTFFEGIFMRKRRSIAGLCHRQKITQIVRQKGIKGHPKEDNQKILAITS